MGEASRTYLEWKAACANSGRSYTDTQPFNLERFLLEQGSRVTSRTKVFEPGTVYRGKVVDDVRVVRNTRGEHCIEYKMHCQRCGSVFWYNVYSLAVTAKDHCRKCIEYHPEQANRLRPFKRKLPDPEPGTKFGELTVVRSYSKVPEGRAKGKQRVVEVTCSCGKTGYVVLLSNLLSGKSTRCDACAKRKAARTQQKLYWKYEDICPDTEHRRRLLNRIANCFQRCTNPNDVNWQNYGGRGITVDFPDRASFLKYIVSLPGWDDPMLELDRIDNARGYAPGNLRFVPKGENMRNRRSYRDLQAYCAALVKENDALRERIRLLEQRAESQVHNSDE